MDGRRQAAGTILVTGGAGFIGTNLIRRLLSEPSNGGGPAPDRIVVFDSFVHGHDSNLRELAGDPRVDIVHGDVRNVADVERVTDHVDQIYHLSAVVGIEHYCEDPLEVIDVNVLGSKNVFECALSKDIRMVFASTSEVFGKNPSVPWSEDADRVLGSTTVERWSYSTSKALCEHMIFALAKRNGFRCSIVRFFNVYGPKQNPIFVISQGVHRALRGERPLTYDSGDQSRCFTYVEDAVEGLILAGSVDEAIGEAFNLGSEVPTRIREVNEIILAESGQGDLLRPQPVDTVAMYGDRYEDIPERVPDVSKAARILGWKARTPIRAGIRAFIRWARENSWWLESRRA